MTALTDPLTEEQRLLLDIAWTTFVEHERFPNFFHVAYRMRKHGWLCTREREAFAGAFGSHLGEPGS
ncbi:hypothetical protein ABT010_40840 [Streptomyces sp. NPDC002668]|uniref:hypothetical protein n=1 Tax=Streptomyces sp. NPDC002668 TaxID=3154422 RepID=UPI003330A068